MVTIVAVGIIVNFQNAVGALVPVNKLAMMFDFSIRISAEVTNDMGLTYWNWKFQLLLGFA